MSYAFISYSTKNQSSADAINMIFKNKGISTWMAPGDIPVGEKYASVINKAIKNCACLILLITNDAQNSKWVSKEIERAINYGKTIIPIKLEDVILNDEFEFYLSTDQLITLPKIDSDCEEMQGIVRVLKSHLKMEYNEKAKYRMIFVVDTSGSMLGKRIQEVNNGLLEVGKSLTHLGNDGFSVDILEYNSSSNWKTLSDLPLQADGSTDLTAALKELLSYEQSMPLNGMCVIMFISDGSSVYPYHNVLQELKTQSWFSKAVKLGIAIGDDVSLEELNNLTDSSQTVIQLNDDKIEVLSTLLNNIAITSAEIIKNGQNQNAQIIGENILKRLKDELDI